MAEVPIEVLLEDRKQTHGSFYEHSRVTQEMKKAFHDAVMRRTSRKQTPLKKCHLEAAEMILHKLGRIVSGNPMEEDHWKDIEGYARIAVEYQDD
jgi:hypothetical protein